jgi:hypothetical protein
MSPRIPLLLGLLLLLLAGCANLSNQVTPGVDLRSVKRIWVERRLGDNNNVRDRIVRSLRAQGLEADAGPVTLMPEKGIDAILGYEDRWTWDFRTYLVELRVELRHPRTRELLASAYVSRGPFAGGSTDDMVDRAARALFRPAAGKR